MTTVEAFDNDNSRRKGRLSLQRSAVCPWIFDTSSCFLLYLRILCIKPLPSVRDGTIVLAGGVHRENVILHAAPDRSVNMLTNESGGVRALNFSPDGTLLVSGE